MLAVMPLSSPTRFAVPRPAVPGAPAVTRADLGVLAIIGLLALTVVAPAAAIALATAAVVVIALWAGLVASGPGRNGLPRRTTRPSRSPPSPTTASPADPQRSIDRRPVPRGRRSSSVRHHLASIGRSGAVVPWVRQTTPGDSPTDAPRRHLRPPTC